MKKQYVQISLFVVIVLGLTMLALLHGSGKDIGVGEEVGLSTFQFLRYEFRARILLDADAEYRLGRHYYFMESESEKGPYWISRAVEHGNPDAQYFLASVLLSNPANKENRARAISLLQQAAAKGHKNSRDELEALGEVKK